MFNATNMMIVAGAIVLVSDVACITRPRGEGMDLPTR